MIQEDIESHVFSDNHLTASPTRGVMRQAGVELGQQKSRLQMPNNVGTWSFGFSFRDQSVPLPPTSPSFPMGKNLAQTGIPANENHQ